MRRVLGEEGGAHCRRVGQNANGADEETNTAVGIEGPRLCKN